LNKKTVVPLIVASALIMQQIDSTSISTALPSMAAGLDTPLLSLHHAITVYFLAQAAFLPISGWLADRFGAKQVFCCAILLFTLASLLCATSTSLPMLIGARLLQGFGGALMLPTGRLILVRSVSREELVSAMILMSLPVVIGPTIGPLVGGLILTMGSWRWIFLINLPFGMAAIAATWFFIDKIPVGERHPFDMIGFVLSGFGIGALIFGLDLFAEQGSGAALSLAVLGMAAMAVYILHSRRNKDAILDLRLFRYATFRSSLLGGSMFRMCFSTVPFLLPLLMQTVFGYTPLQSGSITFISAIGAFGMRTMIKKILDRYGFRNVLLWNTLICGISFALYATFTDATAPAVMMFVIFIGGVFRALQATCINTLAFAEVATEEMSHATSLSQMAQRVSQSLGIASAAILLRHASGASETLTIHDFVVTFLVIATVSTTSWISFFLLPKTAGDTLTSRAGKA
jgi:EmrB/QacA subfamily drug resistance transporter